ncbi:MAG: PEP-CTERM sorting domain-containing protein [Halofilum sp. (in: g-proteobacteria)]|nr:PEP-CTERM sorting domain-containing protein [Halofilum sp. (in: g-proteobacteria)]
MQTPEFGAAILNKLEREVDPTPVPAPGVLTLFGFGLLGLAFASRRRRTG